MKRKYSFLPKMQSRRQPGAHRMGFAAYFTDGDRSEEIKLLKELNTNWETKVKQLNEDLAQKGATLGEMQQAVKELQAKSGQISFSQVPDKKMGMKELLFKEWEANISKIKEYRHDVGYTQQNPFAAYSTKAVGTMTTAANITGASISAIPSFDGFAARGRQLVHARDLIRTINTGTGLYAYFRQNIPAGEGSVAATSGPGQTKPKRDYDNTLVLVNAKYRAGTTDVAVEMIQDIPDLGEYITEELTEDYLRTETFDFIDALTAAATGSGSVPAGVTVLAEKIPHWVANLEQNNYQPTDLVVRPRLWATLLCTKPQDYSTPGGFVITPMGDVIFAGLRLVKCSTNALSDTQVLVGDFRKALIVQKSGEGFRVQIFRQHDQAVYNNIVTFRGEARAEIAIRRPDAFIVGTA